jgi:hypothetical protein
MKTMVGILAATAITLTAAPAFAGAEVAENAHKTVRAEWAKSRAQGGYGFPLTAIPMAIARTFTGQPDRAPIAQSQDKPKSN